MSSFRRRNPGIRPRFTIPGTRTSPHTGQLITSSGNPSLDVVLGGGLPVGSICLIEEDKYVTHSKVLAKYFVAEGIVSQQTIFLASLDEEPAGIIDKLPKPLTDSEAEEELKAEKEKAKADGKTESDSLESGLRIAWRYNDLPIVNSEQPNSKIGHHYNLLEPMDRMFLNYADIICWNDGALSDSPEKSGDDDNDDNDNDGDDDKDDDDDDDNEIGEEEEHFETATESSEVTDSNKDGGGKERSSAGCVKNAANSSSSSSSGSSGSSGADVPPLEDEVMEDANTVESTTKSEATTDLPPDSATNTTTTITATTTTTKTADAAQHMDADDVDEKVDDDDDDDDDNDIAANAPEAPNDGSDSMHSAQSSPVNKRKQISSGTSSASPENESPNEKNKVFFNAKYRRLLHELHPVLLDERFTPGTLGHKALCRVCITSLGSPLWYDENFAKDIIKFFTVLRAQVLRSASVCFITMPMHLVAKYDAQLVTKIRSLVDYSIELESFAGSERETHPSYKNYSGLLHLHKIGAINTLSAYVPETRDLAFKLRRKKFVIEKFHLPPELEEESTTAEEAATTASAEIQPESVASRSCGSKVSPKSKESMDF